MIPVINAKHLLINALKETFFSKPSGNIKANIRCGIKKPEQKLCHYDVMSGTIIVRRAAAFSYRLDTTQLLDSLHECLKEFPYFCGRLKQYEDHWSLDGNDAGLSLSIVQHDSAMPAYGYQHTMKKQMRGLCEPLAFSSGNKDKALMGIRITHYKDGTVIGISNSHVLMDGTGAWQFLQRWAEHYRNELKPAHFTQDRSPLLFLDDDIQQATPSPYYSSIRISKLALAAFFARCIASFATGKTTVLHLPAATITNAKQQINDVLPEGQSVSTQDVAMALIIEPLLSSTKQSELIFGTLYNFRHLVELGFSPQYIGNAATAREFILSQNSNAKTAATTIRRLAGTLLSQHVLADSQYMQSTIAPHEGMRHHPEFMARQFTNGVLLNNYTRFPMYQVDFGGGTAIWADYPDMTLNRCIALLPDPKGDGVAAHVTLPRKELEKFHAIISRQHKWKKQHGKTISKPRNQAAAC
jgi:shikimate O-hydroxycinnamoyltransferase